jgi:hypothetical protein
MPYRFTELALDAIELLYKESIDSGLDHVIGCIEIEVILLAMACNIHLGK